MEEKEFVELVPLIKEIVAADPEHAGANYALGCEVIYEFLSARKRTDEAERYRRCIVDYSREVELAQLERNNINATDDFKYHEVAPEVIRELRDQLKHYSDLGSAHLVQKAVNHFPEEPA